MSRFALILALNTALMLMAGQNIKGAEATCDASVSEG
jgi:hypothetical protein